ncbi:MAG: DUF5615 family PIN-like protein [Methylococcaceae bacterium]|nr:DUF5615 family PIN-like protein [Methylococcaceae bacterium]
MIFWIDAQLSPALAVWIAETFHIEAKALRELGLRDATDMEIFDAAKNTNAVIVTKDSDFLDLLDRYGSPPQILWVTCGNTSNAKIKEILLKAMPRAIELLKRGERMVEISDAWP